MKLIPLLPNSKEPLRGKSWLQRISDDPETQRNWLRRGLNIGCPQRHNNLTVADFDVPGTGEQWIEEHGGEVLLSVIVRTRKGLHLYFSGQTQTRKFAHGDIKSGIGYCVFPPSRVDGHKYEFLRNDWGRLSPFPEELFPYEAPGAPPGTVTDGIRNVRRYVRGIRAISGSGGHNATFRAACCLRDAGFSEAEALAEMVEWNQTNAEPPWTVKELLHKVRDAYAKVMQ
jgi:hypothetical protein